MVPQAPKCAKCHTSMVAEHGHWSCLSCGQELDSDKASRQYHETNKDAIIETYRQGGAAAVKREWGASGSTWFSLRKRWGVELHAPRRTPAPISKNGAMPSLPAWRDDWPEAVMLRWLDALVSLKGGK